MLQDGSTPGKAYLLEIGGMCPQNIEFVDSEFGKVLKGVEKIGNVLMKVFRLMSVCNRDFNKVRILSVRTMIGKQRRVP